MGKRDIIIGIGILVILLALAGTGSARSSYPADCDYCHTSIPTPLTANGILFNETHKFDGIKKPSSGNSCSQCHVDTVTSDFSMTQKGLNYSNVHNGAKTSGYARSIVNCTYCHTNPNLGDFSLKANTGIYFKQIHKFDGVTIPNNATGCIECHTDVMVFLPLTSTGQNYSIIHRYNDTILASEMLSAPACYNCHKDVINNDFDKLSGTPTYLTSTTCENCHKAKYDNWTNTLHRVMLTEKSKAQAMDLPEPEVGWANISYVIVTKFAFAYINTTGYFPAQNDTYNTETKEFENGHNGSAYGTCGNCHTTNWNTSGDNSSLPGFYGTFSEPGIACERCHEPAGNGHQVVINYSGDQCLECHSGGRHGTGWENGEHAPPPYENGNCMFCHSSFDQYKNQNVTIANATGVSCGVCHNTHDMTDNKYAETFSEGIFNNETWSEVADSKLSFFNATASYISLTGGSTGTLTAGNDIFDDLSNTLLYPGRDTNRKDPSYGDAPINVTGRPVSEVLCSMCHYRHGLAHIAGVNLTHSRMTSPQSEWATCTDCHMAGTNATVGKDMMKKHSNYPLKDVSQSCGGTTKCHITSAQNLNKSSFSIVPIVNEWNQSLHNDKVNGGFYENGTNDRERASSCSKCHSPVNWNPANESSLVGVDAFKGITCEVCHNIHDMGEWLKKTKAVFGEEKPYAWYDRDAVVAANDSAGVPTRYKANYSMMANTTELCGNCHSNIRIGNTGPGYGTPSSRNPTGIISPHGFPAKDIFVGSLKQTNDFECIDCHMAKKITDPTNLTEMVLPDSQKVTGHSFKVNVPILQNETKCLGCHELGNIITRIEVIQGATHEKWNATNITVQTALAEVIAYTGEKNLSRDLIAKAYWNLRLVSSDESWGVHNPIKVNNLLNESSTLANDALAALGTEGGNLSITRFSPTTPTVIDVVGGPTRTFSITVNQVANVSWQINETEVSNETGVTTSSYPNDSAAEGTWNVTAVAENTNGSVMRNWIWTVSPQVAGYTISGFKINSANNLSVSGWTINLTNATMNVSATTAENGMYQFMGLANGTYNVTEMMQTGWTNVTPTSIDVLIEGVDVMNKNFTNTPPVVAGYTISGFKINSANNLSVPGWTINLTNATMNVSATTAENGMYQFTGLANGTYNVTEMMQTGWTNVTPTSIDVLIEGVDVMNKNFTNTPPVVAGYTISGFKINSENNLGVPGWTINLTNATMNVSATTTENGRYQFTGLANGTYTVTEIMQTGWTNVTPASIDVHIEGADVMDQNFTNTPPVVSGETFNISGYKIDNGTGMGLETWNITLTNSDSTMMNNLTDSNGMYQFMNLPNGTYTVAEEMQTGWMNVSPMSIEVTINGADMMDQNFTNAIIPPVPKVTSFELTPSKTAAINGSTIDITVKALNVSVIETNFNGMANISATASKNADALIYPQNITFNNGIAILPVTSNVVQFVTVTATNGSITASTEVAFADWAFDLDLGWNLISIPNFADPSSVDMALKNVKNNGVVGYDPATKNFSTPTDLHPLYGYWINVTAPNQSIGFIADTSITSVPPSRNLYEGWNLIGVVAEEKDMDKILDAGLLLQPLRNGEQPLYSFLVSYKNPRRTYAVGVDLTDRTQLNQGQGYWLFIKTMTGTNKNSVIWSGKPWLPN